MCGAGLRAAAGQWRERGGVRGGEATRESVPDGGRKPGPQRGRPQGGAGAPRSQRAASRSFSRDWKPDALGLRRGTKTAGSGHVSLSLRIPPSLRQPHPARAGAPRCPLFLPRPRRIGAPRSLHRVAAATPLTRRQLHNPAGSSVHEPARESPRLVPEEGEGDCVLRVLTRGGNIQRGRKSG